MESENRNWIEKSVAGIIAGTLIGIGRIIYTVLSAIFGILSALAG